MKAAVIVHRWFAQGADWAFSPQIKPILRDIIEALDERQKAGQPGIFKVEVSGQGVLFGEIVHDVESLDPKARHRRPTILRAVLLECAPDQSDTARLMEGLRSIWPTRCGADANLILVADAIIVPTARANGRTHAVEVPRRPNRRKVVIMAALGTASVVAVALALVAHQGSGSNEQKDDLKPLRPIIQTMNLQLSGWGHAPKTGPPEAVINDYFGFLCQSSVWHEAPASNHPYVKFILRLPKQPFHAAHDQWTKDELETDLRKLAASLEGGKSDADDASTAERCFQRVDEQMNYDDWRTKYRDRDADQDAVDFATAPDVGVIEFVERFRKNASLSSNLNGLKEPADQMRVQLKRWNFTTSDDATPLEVFRQFFSLALQRPTWLSKCGGSDKKHAYWRFLERLPEEPSSLGWTCDDSDQLRHSLQELLHDIGGGAGDGKTVAGLIEAISTQMEYEKWVVEHGRDWQKAPPPESKDLSDYVQHFRAVAGSDSKPEGLR